MQSQILKLEDEVCQSDVLAHPFLDRFREGTLTSAQVKAFTSQQYHFSNTFARCLTGLHSRIPDYYVSGPYIKHFSSEPWGVNNPQSHSHLFRKWMNILRIEEKDISLYPETQRFLEKRLELCTNLDYHIGLGSLAYGHEFVNKFLFAIYLDGLRKIGFRTDQLDYFSAHVRDEGEDYAVLRKMIVDTTHNKSDIESLCFGARKTLVERALFFDALHTRLEGE